MTAIMAGFISLLEQLLYNRSYWSMGFVTTIMAGFVSLLEQLMCNKIYWSMGFLAVCHLYHQQPFFAMLTTVTFLVHVYKKK